MLTRREFNQQVATGLLGAAATANSLWGQQERPVLCQATLVNSERLWQSLQELSRFGQLAAGGTTRIGFSPDDLAAHNWLLGLLRDAGLDVMVDAAANIRARRAGERNDLPALWFGSHMDTVPRGGNFDGCVGSMSALEVIRTLNEK
ncbi:MAG: Zn-dependent hydrolase, partial [Candidatus Acidiferrales bacterium]